MASRKANCVFGPWVIILLLGGISCKRDQRINRVSSTPITQIQMEKIKAGLGKMDYQEACIILNGPGEKTKSDLAPSHTVYVWKDAQGSSMTLNFEGDRLVQWAWMESK